MLSIISNYLQIKTIRRVLHTVHLEIITLMEKTIIWKTNGTRDELLNLLGIKFTRSDQEGVGPPGIRQTPGCASKSRNRRLT